MNINDQHLRFIFFIFFSFLLCFVMLVCGYVLGGRSYFKQSPEPFESGIVSVGSAHMQVPIKFSLIAIFFVLFDVEVLYLYIWSLGVREAGWIGLLNICFFIHILLMTLFYLIRNNIFKWIILK
ncbi:NADH-quinone oxidoreductase subunit A [Buchnera aphidicola]|nr:NADH-quinone oxidoreductase subunit A [Buchnera aphidicola]